MTSCARQQLQTTGLRYSPRLVEQVTHGVGLSHQEGFDHLGIFGGHDRAGGVQQDAAGFKQWPEVIEQCALQLSQLGNVGGAAQDFDIRVTADNAGGGAGGVEQDAVK